MADFKGGRGKRAPYETELLRVPTPIKPVVQALADSYRKTADTDPAGENLVKQLQSVIAEGSSSKHLLAQSQVQLAKTRVQLAKTRAQLAEARAQQSEARAQLAKGRAQLEDLREENTRLTRQQEKKPPKSFKGFGK